MDGVKALSPELLAKMKQIQFRMKSLVSETFAGEYESAFKGRGIEFEEVRSYMPGDDIRTIDWKVTARTGLPHVKMYREERELTIMFLVDVSASMRFATKNKFKSELAAELTALLAYTALKNNDKTGLIIFSDHVEHYIPPKKGHAHIWRVIRDILSHRSSTKMTNLNLPLEYLNRVAKRKAIAFLISDFQGEGYEKILRQTAKHHDLIAVHISDPKEHEMTNVGLIELEDAENSDVMVIDTKNKKIRSSWKNIMSEEEKKRTMLFRSSNIDQITISTDGSIVDPIIKFFKKRERLL